MGFLVLLVVIALGIAAFPLYHWERRRERQSNRFESAIARAQRSLQQLDSEQLRARLGSREYLTSLAAAPIVQEIRARLDADDPRALLDGWERVSRELATAERAAGNAGKLRLMECETELQALLRALDFRLSLQTATIKRRNLIAAEIDAPYGHAELDVVHFLTLLLARTNLNTAEMFDCRRDRRTRRKPAGGHGIHVVGRPRWAGIFEERRS